MSPENILQGLKSFDVGVKKNRFRNKAKRLFPGFGKLGTECALTPPPLPDPSFLWVSTEVEGGGERVHHEYSDTERNAVTQMSRSCSQKDFDVMRPQLFPGPSTDGNK